MGTGIGIYTGCTAAGELRGGSESVAMGGIAGVRLVGELLIASTDCRCIGRSGGCTESAWGAALSSIPLLIGKAESLAEKIGSMLRGSGCLHVDSMVGGVEERGLRGYTLKVEGTCSGESTAWSKKFASRVSRRPWGQESL